MAVRARVCTAAGLELRIAEGTRLVFGRGPEVDLAVPAGVVAYPAAGPAPCPRWLGPGTVTAGDR